MKIGLFGIGSGICADPQVAAEVAKHAEARGLDSLWTGEHVVLPEPRQAPSPADPDFAMLHPSTILAYVAAVTHSIRLGTGIVLIAQRNPVVLAKEMASLDVVSGGRLLLGIVPVICIRNSTPWASRLMNEVLVPTSTYTRCDRFGTMINPHSKVSL